MTVATQNTHTTITAPGTDVRPLPPSIRSIIRNDIMEGVAKSETARKIAEWHAETAANTKFAKHYAWYKGQLKKEGKLPVAQA